MESMENAFSLTHRANPYIYDRPIPAGGLFFGRTELLEAITEELRVEESRLFLLQGPPHIGKTSLLLHLADHLPEPFLPVYFDLNERSSQPLPLLVRDLASEIVLAAGGTPAPRRRLEDVGQAHWMLLQALHEAVLGRRLVLLFDQFDVPKAPLSEDAAGLRLFPYLQELSKLPAAPAFVITGDRRLELPAGTASLPLFQAASVHRLSVLTAAEARKLLVDPSEGHCVYEPQAVKAALDLTGRHPWLMQLLASQLYELPRRRALDPLRTLEVAACMHRALAEAEGRLDTLWRSLSGHEQVLVSAIAQFSPPERPVRLEELATLLETHSARMADTELVDGLTGLAELELIQREGSGRMYCSAGMIRTWLVEHHRFVVGSSQAQKSATRRRQERAAAAERREEMTMNLSLQPGRKVAPDAVEDLWNVAESQLGMRAGEANSPPRRPSRKSPLAAPPMRQEVEIGPRASSPQPVRPEVERLASRSGSFATPSEREGASRSPGAETSSAVPEEAPLESSMESSMETSLVTPLEKGSAVGASQPRSLSRPLASQLPDEPLFPPEIEQLALPEVELELIGQGAPAPQPVEQLPARSEELEHRLSAGQNAYVQGNLEGAIEAYRQALVLEPGHIEATLGLSRALLESHEFSPAIQVLQTGIGQAPDVYLETLGEVYVRWLDEVEQDEEMWVLVMDEAMQALPDHAELRRRQRGTGALRVRRLLTDGRPVEAAAALGALGSDLHEALPEVLAPLLEALETLTRRGLPDADPLFTLLRRLLPEPRAAWQRYLGPLLDEAERSERYNPDRAEELLRRAESVLITAGVDGNYAPDQLRERLQAGLRRLETIRLHNDEAQLNQMLEAGDLDGAEAWLEDLLMRRRSTQLEEKLRTVRGQRQLVARYHAALASRDQQAYAEAQRLLALVVGESPSFVGPDGRSALEVLDEVTSLKMGMVERPAVAQKRRGARGVASLTATALVTGLAVTLYFQAGIKQAPEGAGTQQHQASRPSFARASAGIGAPPAVLVLDGQAPRLAEGSTSATNQPGVTSSGSAPTSPVAASSAQAGALPAPEGSSSALSASNVQAAGTVTSRATPPSQPLIAKAAPGTMPGSIPAPPPGSATATGPASSTAVPEANATLAIPARKSALPVSDRPASAASRAAAGPATSVASRAAAGTQKSSAAPGSRGSAGQASSISASALAPAGQVASAASASSADPSDPYQAGLEAARAGRTEEALADFRRALEQNPTRAEVYADLGDLYQRQGRSMDALRSYQRAVSLNERLARAHYALGRLHQTQGHRDEAVSAFQTVVRLDPMSAAGHDAQVRLNQLQRSAAPPASAWGDGSTQTGPAPVQLFTGQ